MATTSDFIPPFENGAPQISNRYIAVSYKLFTDNEAGIREW